MSIRRLRTPFDFGAATRRCKDELGDHANRLTTLWRDKQRQYTWLRAAQGRHADFWHVTGDPLDFALETLRPRTPSSPREAYGTSSDAGNGRYHSLCR